MKHRRLPRHLHLSFCLLLLISISHHIVPVRCGCGDAFDVAAAQALAPPADLDCSTARLLVHSINYEDFEGMGSILHAVAESAAEAYWEGRVLLWGPPSVAPLLLRNVTDRGVGGMSKRCRKLTELDVSACVQVLATGMTGHNRSADLTHPPCSPLPTLSHRDSSLRGRCVTWPLCAT